MTSLRIVITADPELPVPPRLYGGIERVVALLADGLVAGGHDVTLVAHPDSHVDASLIPYSRPDGRGLALLANASTIAKAVASVRPDVVHSFGRLASLGAVLPSRVPKVMSYQRAVTPSRVAWATRLGRDSVTFVGCSRSLIEAVSRDARWRVVYNATDVERTPFGADPGPDAPLVFLGRIEAIKGAHTAISVARRTGRRLVLAGNVPAGHETYFDREIKPHVDDRNVEYVGPVDDETKGALLARAGALLMPIEWEEPFGIVMAEALAAGTPVLGFRRGAVPEVVEHGVTGFVCSNEDEMVRAVPAVRHLSRAACRQAAADRFSQRAMVTGYERVYAEAIAAVHGQVATAR
ncbi:MAG TPA: glycosyltransferase [Vicinamibacterales bacterium]|nr:glycosyltransferase [Vicinamibacterales bacterium]